MMPLWIYTVGERLFDIEGYTAPPLPFGNIMKSLLLLLVPIGFGMAFGFDNNFIIFDFLATWKPNTIPRFKKYIKRFTLCAVFFIISSSVYVNWLSFYIFDYFFRFVFQLIFGFQKHALVPGALTPISAFTVAYIVGHLLCQHSRDCRTIAIETGIQNAGYLNWKFSKEFKNGLNILN